MTGFDVDANNLGHLMAGDMLVERTPLMYGVYIDTNHQRVKYNLTSFEMRASDFNNDAHLSTDNGTVEVEAKLLYTHIKCTQSSTSK
jgi:hypothetical protein